MFDTEKKSGGELVLESKHLAGLFLLLVVIFGVVFTLGYLMGRSQYDTKLRGLTGATAAANAPAGAPSSKSKDAADPAENLPSQNNSDFDFYHSGEPKTGEDHLVPPGPSLYAKSMTATKNMPAGSPAAPAPAAAKPVAAKSAKQAKSPAPLNAPLIPKGAVILQVAAVLHESDALALAQALQQKKFPAFVLTPTADKYYRVQVGPYGDNQKATTARQDLEAKGFKSIVKR